ncbi:carbon-nitrogen hydrolase family protein [Albidovulum sp.]|uniref:carbon-nitrogen hydrolase family protein n=1 Tax=Albidovulum sp. TaxID=1872424 RepID=UPI001D95AB3D|nr:carbon-nitrogen hydrolase family protein [Paracoccaceae bacterium]MCC0045593.1 carbon-nitrogen hydrolase family protein [Defluviimonas sp.]HPE25560.1 carbon-nitrogen hydrolase family protein [Albidovulum sp.]MCB2118524.1 carbon-nitrogen hydrolase family protein [Paracoccaceae bacterium]MCB2121208.1 carbon-nitrogen hydrolase family protein [Paracoccaceae bacterium]
MKVGLLQLCSSDRPAENLAVTRDLLRQAASAGASFILTPEVTNCVSSDRGHQDRVLQTEAEDITLAGLRAEAQALGVWLLIGSLAIKTKDGDGRLANRSFLVAPDGAVAARYDKIHMFDVNVSETEQYRESAGFRPGGRAVLATAPFARIGLSVCYDLRFPHLYRRLAQAGAEILTVPAAFNDTTGAAHWESLLRARAIENGAFVLAPAQSGSHAAHNGRPRRTWGHSMIVAPWGEVLADAGTDVGATVAEIDLAAVSRARHRVPSLTHDRDFEGP